MSDPIDKLSSLGDALEGAPVPLPASEIRARGDRIRRRRHALVAGASVAVVAAVAVPVIALSVGDGSEEPDHFAPQPTVSDSVAPARLSANHLITEEDAAWNEVGTEFEEVATYPGDGQATPSPCTQESFAGLGAERVFQRDFRWKAQEPGTDIGPQIKEIIGEFGSPDQAQAAYDEIRSWYADCHPPEAETYDAGEFRPVDLPVDGEGVQMLATYGPVSEEIDPFGDESWYLDTGLVVSGDRVALITALSHGQDYANGGPAPATQMVPVAAERLVLGNGVEQGSTTGEGEGFIPDDFPLAAGWPASAGSDGAGLEGPNRTLPSLEFEACDSAFVEPDYLERMRANWSGAEDYRARQLTMYDSAEPATAAVEGLAGFFRSCGTGPVREDGYRTEYEVVDVEAGDQAVAILQRDTLDGAESPFGSTTVVVRVGTAVLIIDHAGHAGYPQGNGRQSITTELDEAAEVIAAMGDLQDRLDDSATDDEPEVLGLDGYGALRLGMTSAEVDSTGEAVVTPAADGQGCGIMTVTSWADTVHPNVSGRVHGFVSQTYGLAILFAQPGMVTPEGIGVGSTIEEVRAAYGELGGSDAYTTTPVDGARYFFLTDGERVTAWQVELAEQDCVH